MKRFSFKRNIFELNYTKIVLVQSIKMSYNDINSKITLILYHYSL